MILIRRMPHLTVLAVLAVLAACAPAPAGGPTRATHSPNPTATPATPPRVLFQADWSQGLATWQPSSGWALVAGAPQSDTGADRTLTVPFQPPARDYEVDFTLQILDIPRTGGQFALRTAPAGGDAGIDVGVFGLRAGSDRPNGDHPTIFSYLDPLSAQDPTTSQGDVHDYEPGTGPRTYQVTLRGSLVSLAVDGHFFGSAASTFSAHLAASPIQLLCSGVAVRLVALRILSV